MVAGPVAHQLTYGSENSKERLLQRYRRLERKSEPGDRSVPT